MPLLEICIIAVALSMDAFAVAVATGVKLGDVSPRQSFRLSFHFGLFQFLMPLLGWLLGLTVREYIETWDHWVAFALLAFVGLNMIRESFSAETESSSQSADPTKGASLVLLSVATSIDALAVGLSLAVLGQEILFPATLIGIICAALTFVGLRAGSLASAAANLGGKAALVGGGVLILIGLNILREHQVFSL